MLTSTILRVSNLLRTYTTSALKATYAYEVCLLRISNLLCTCTSSALEATYAYKVRLLRVSDLCFKVFLVP